MTLALFSSLSLMFLRFISDSFCKFIIFMIFFCSSATFSLFTPFFYDFISHFYLCRIMKVCFFKKLFRYLTLGG